MKSIKSLFLATSLFMLCVLSPCFAFASSYVTMSELRSEAEAGWHKTYSFNGQEIQVDVLAEIPDVAQVPAVRIVYPSGFDASIPDGAEVLKNGETFSYEVMADEMVILGKKFGEADLCAEPDARAENSPLSQEEAQLFMEEVMLASDSSITANDLYHMYTLAYSRKYESSDEGGSFQKDYDKPTTQMGQYSIRYGQLFHGVPILPYEHPYYEQHPDPDKWFTAPVGAAEMYISTKDNYIFWLETAKEDGIIVEDLPLAPFDKVLAAFGEQIETGYIRSVYRLKFGYLAHQNPDDPGNSWVLVPVWMLRGGIVNEPSFPDPPQEYDSIELTQRYGGGWAYVNAQTGEYLEPKDKSATRGYADIITWEQAN